MSHRRRFVIWVSVTGLSLLVALVAGLAIAQGGVSLDAPATLPADI